ncbi:hypothetical protein Enr13x_58700 [Stieleria neptunia]|uniref:Uncharacterized protein n=1 Tax=Stieleria neptunia TaxID=2527979 RepID=A0A518HYN4_9BACT|nr:hypothetical protein [Stieleria neptunia]QDV45966.1 hypothetical protein Enr13x_58700 [Stieleria neptunia]
MTTPSSLKKPLLYLLIGSVLLSALLGIVLVLRGNWGWLEVRVILTTVIIAVASVCGLACDLSRTPSGFNAMPKSGLVLTAVTTVLLLFGIWCEIGSEAYWKTTTVLISIGVATIHVSLLSIAKLANRFRWVYFIGSQIIFGLALLIAAVIVFEINSELLWRFLAAHSIVVAAISIVIPILHRISKTDANRGDLLMPVEARNVDSIDRQIAQLEERLAQLRTLREQIVGGTLR